MGGWRGVARPRPRLRAEQIWMYRKMGDRVETNQERSDQPSQPANGASHIPSDAPPLSGRDAVLGLVLLMIVTVVVAVAGIVPRIHARSKLKQDTDALAAPNVTMNPPKQGQTAQEIV